MLRSGFFAFGMFVALWGGAFLAIDRIVLKVEQKPEDAEKLSLKRLLTSIDADKKHVFRCPDWGAFSLMSIGSVTMLYAVALPKKGSSH